MTKSIDERIKEIVSRSGFPLEHKACSVLKENGYNYELHDSFIDTDTDKDRELDIHAYKHFDDMKPNLMIELPIECKKIPDNVWILRKFPLDAQHYKIYAPYIISDISILNRWDTTIASIISNEEKPLHFIRNYNMYNDFQEEILNKDKSNKKKDNLFTANIKLIKSLYYNKIILTKDKLDFIDYMKRNKEFIEHYPLSGGTVNFYLPIILFDGHLYESYMEDNEIVTNRIKYGQILTNIENREYKGTYVIEIMTKDYFSDYLKEINKDIDILRTLFKNKIGSTYFKSLANLLEQYYLNKEIEMDLKS